MRTSHLKIAVVILLALNSTTLWAVQTSEEEKLCGEIGFKRNTEDFGECVFELLDRRGSPLDQAIPSGRDRRADDDIKSMPFYVSTPARATDGGLWDLKKLALSDSFSIYLYRKDKSIYDTIRVSDVKTVMSVAAQLSKISGIDPLFLLRESGELNASAGFDKQGNPIVFIYKPMFDIIARDPDMAAALLGHEIAHLHYKHGHSSAEHQSVGNAIAVISGVLLEGYARKKTRVQNLGFNAGRMLGVAYVTSFSRDQEREADRQGQFWASKSGYDSLGAVRLFEVLQKRNGNALIPFFRTHPNPSERIENALKLKLPE